MNTNTLRVRITLLFAGIFLTVAGAANARDISMVTANSAPYYSDELKNGGVMTVLVQAALARAGHNASIRFVPWAQALKLVEDGEDDIVLGAYFSKEREKKYILSFPFYKIPVGLVSRSDLGVTSFKSLEDLKPYRIGVSRGRNNSTAFGATDILNIDTAKDPAANLQKLARNRIDMMIVAFDLFRYEAVRAGLDFNDFSIISPPLVEHPIYLMGSRRIPDGDQIINDFNRGMLELLEDGSYKQILKEYGF